MWLWVKFFSIKSQNVSKTDAVNSSLFLPFGNFKRACELVYFSFEKQSDEHEAYCIKQWFAFLNGVHRTADLKRSRVFKVYGVKPHKKRASSSVQTYTDTRLYEVFTFTFQRKILPGDKIN